MKCSVFHMDVRGFNNRDFSFGGRIYQKPARELFYRSQRLMVVKKKDKCVRDYECRSAEKSRGR